MTQIKIIDAAIANDVKRFIPSDFGPNTPDMSVIEQHLPVLYQRLKPKKMILDYLDEKASRNLDFTWTAIGAAPLFDWVFELDFSHLEGCIQLTSKSDSQIRFPRHLSSKPHIRNH
jgi:hypothetical protein